MVIIGINPAIDSTAVLLKDGKIMAAIAEERLSRRKLHYGFPKRAISECLRISKINPHEVDRVVFSYDSNVFAHPALTKSFLEKNWSPFDKENIISIQLALRTFLEYWRDGGRKLWPPKTSHPAYYFDNEKMFKNSLAKVGIDRAELNHFDHHACHAASAFYCSGFSDCLVITADGAGDLLWTTISVGKNGELSRLSAIERQTSIGLFYAAITKYLGFKPHRHEGKVTGLAAFGNPQKYIKVMKQALDINSKGEFVRRMNTSKWKVIKLMLGKLLMNQFMRHPEVNLFLDHFQKNLSGASREDVAAAAQALLEELMVKWVKQWVKKTGKTKIALAGGIFANVRLNQKISEIPGIKNVYVQPNMGDGGTALGAALLTWQRFLEEQGRVLKPELLANVYLGPDFSDSEISKAIKQSGLKGKLVNNIEEKAAKAISEGKIVGWFQGRMEWGPRALGNRSLLASATDRTINDTLNARLKRTEFMPFAPSVLDTDVSKYMKYSERSHQPSRFMTITFDCTALAKKEIPAVVHVDGTARPQIVEKKTNPKYYRVLQEYKKITGLGIFVNTSFNIHEEPIVCTPQDAIRSYKLNSCDVLAMGNWWIE